MIDLWRSADEFVLLEAFRQAAKSTLAEEFLLMEGCFGNFNYCVLFGETYDKACQRLESIVREANGAALVSMFGGSTVLARKPIENKVWFKSGALIEAFGWEQEITGMKYGDSRPDRAYLDDVENVERVRSEGAVLATMKKIYRELMPAMDKNRRKVRITQTPRAADCMVTRLKQDPDWVCRSYPICNGDIDDPATVATWPARYPMSWIRRERDRYASMGMLTEFMQEYMLEVTSVDQKPFTEEMICGVEIAPQAWLPRIAIYDPARTAAVKSSDRTGKVVVSRMGSRIVVHESGGYFWKPDEIVADMFDVNARHVPATIAVETNALDDFIMQPIRSEMMKRGVALPVVGVQAPQDRDKAAFMMGLHPFFKAGDVVLVGGRGCHQALVSEVLNFPGGKDDVLNALAYSLRLFGGQPSYEDFSEANIVGAEMPTARDTVLMAWNASNAEVVCVALLASGRYLTAVRDWVVPSPLPDAVRVILGDARAAFRGIRLDHYLPEDLMEQWQRIPMVPALRALNVRPIRAGRTSTSRAVAAEALRMEVKHRRWLSVGKDCRHVINALAGGYKYPMMPGGRIGSEPVTGSSRIVAESVETVFSVLQKEQQSLEVSGHYGYNPQGVKYLTALPERNHG
jgi:hypothetical protein